MYLQNYNVFEARNMKDEVLTIRIDSELKEKSQALAESSGYTISKLVIASLRDLVRRGKIPLNLFPYLGPSKQNGKLSIHKIKRIITDYMTKNYSSSVDKVYLFGSYARGEEKKTSDIDIRLIVSDDFSLFDVGVISSDLKDMLKKDVDIVTGSSFSPLFLNELNRDQICIYERNQ